jgi:hypothetical protein
VKAYRGSLPGDIDGFEFFTGARPDRPHGTRMYWRARQDDSVREEDGTAKIQVLIARVSQDIE